MVPVYAIDSYLSLWFPKIAFYINAMRDAYEAYVIYNFVAMCLCYVGGSSQLVSMWQEDNMTIPGSLITGTCCLRKVVLNHVVLRRCIQGVLQYIIVKLVTTVAAFICELAGVLHEGSLSPKYAYLYIIVIMNVSVMVALFSLLVFALSTKKYLKPFGPLLKFTALKLIIFVTWWQSMVISVLVATDIISPAEGDERTKGEIAIDLQDWLMCLEVFPFAFLMFIAYPANLVKEKDYPGDKQQKDVTNGLSKERLELADSSKTSTSDTDLESNGAKSGESDKESSIEVVRKGRNNAKGGFFYSFRHALAIKDILDDTRTYTDYQYGDFTSLGRQGDDMEAGDDEEDGVGAADTSSHDEHNDKESVDSRSENFPSFQVNSFADFGNNSSDISKDAKNEPASSSGK